MIIQYVVACGCHSMYACVRQCVRAFVFMCIVYSKLTLEMLIAVPQLGFPGNITAK